VYRCQHDQQLTIEFITAWSERITGYAPEDLVSNRRISRVDLIHPDDRKNVLSQYEEALAEHKPGRINYRIITATGDIKWISDRFQGVYAETNEVIAIEGFFNDITQQIEAEKELTQALLEVEYLKNRLEEENIYLRQEIRLSYNFENIISRSEKFTQVLAQVEQVAATDATVLILGETGTGKELVARAVHNLSTRSERSLVKVNCAALPANLIESELFGHEKGAFTGAVARKVGRFELADGSSIFLDEIGELPLDLQVKLLRVLQEGEFERLGSTQTLKVHVRVIAATNRDLEKAVQNGSFREDLFYRLNVFPIQIPPLRDRPEDVPLLVKYFIQKFSKKTGKQIEHVPRKVMEILQGYHWPGNIRELENIIERAVILSPGKRLELGEWFSPKDTPSKSAKLATLEEVERTHILKALKKTRWRVSGDNGAAKMLAIHPQTLVSRMKKLGIQRPV
jgi:PAS domain S-box-containing protein